jgi:hypothetical protein
MKKSNDENPGIYLVSLYFPPKQISHHDGYYSDESLYANAFISSSYDEAMNYYNTLILTEDEKTRVCLLKVQSNKKFGIWESISSESNNTSLGVEDPKLEQLKLWEFKEHFSYDDCQTIVLTRIHYLLTSDVTPIFESSIPENMILAERISTEIAFKKSQKIY